MKSNIILNQLLIGVTALLCSVQAEPQYYQNHEKGWHWYEIQEVEEKPEPAAEVLSTDSDKKEETKRKSPKEIVARYREELENRLADAWMHPTPHKIKAYQEMQQDMVERSKTFSEGWMKNVFLNPELDNTIANPVNQQARHVQLDLQKKQVVETIKNLAKEYGLFFFFSGECEFCHRFAPIVKHFSDQYGWQVLPISLDGGQLELFPNAQPDNGLFEQWQQGGQGQGQVMPALYAVNPNTGHVIPVAHDQHRSDGNKNYEPRKNGRFYMKTYKGIVASLVLCLFSSSLQAPGIAADLMTFFKSAGMASNVTSPGSYKDQTGGYYTGGSVMARTGARNAQLATVQMPGFRAGCGGIDAWSGGFSHISSEALVEMLRSIGSSAKSYAFLLAVQTVSPQIYNIMNEINAVATQINQTNINSCEAAATMLGGIWPKSDQSSKHLCQAMGSNLGAFSDWSAARQGCGAKGDRESVLNRAGADPKYKDMLVGEFNLAWKAIQANAFLSADKQLARLFLTLVGSIISRRNGDSYETLMLPGHADRDDVLNGLLNGGDTPIYACDEDGKCLNPRLEQIVLPDSSALFKRTDMVLESLIDKIYTDGIPTQEEKDFLNSTKLPVYKMLNVISAFRKGYAPLDIHMFAEIIAIDILFKYVIEVIDIVHDSVAQLKSVQVDDAHMDRFLGQLRHARERITEKRKSAYQQMDSTLSMIQSTQVIEKQLHVMMGSVANEYNWV